MNTAVKTDFLSECFVYVSRIRLFTKTDWLVYIVWVGMMYGLFAVVGAFFYAGWKAGVEFPAYAWHVPIGTFIFSTAIAFDTIGHRTEYKEILQKGEALVHHLTIFAGVTSVIGLCLAYEHGPFMRIPVLVMIALSVLYSVVDEALHWHRYLTRNSDRVEMWSHFFILTGHLMMIIAWYKWFDEGYVGVAETLAALK